MTFVRIRAARWTGLMAVALLALTGLPAQSQTLRNGPAVVAAFKDVVAKPSQSTVRVLCDGKETALGTVVGADGWILTKASDLKGQVRCQLKDGRTFDAVCRGVEEKHDLAMLKIDIKGLVPIEWRSSKAAEVGCWVASAGLKAEPIAIGVVSVATRRPTPRDYPLPTPAANSGFLGISLAEEDGPPKIGRVEADSAAAKAGLKVGDVVLTIAGEKVESPEALIVTIQKFRVGDVVALQVRRQKDGKPEVVAVQATLGRRPAAANPGFNRGEMQNRMGSDLSKRRGGFPVILQHDTVIAPTDCGGPLVDLDGKAVGINIARAGRTESYAIPSEAVLPLLADLKSGKLAPRVEPELARMERSLQRLRADLKRAEDELKSIDKEQRGVEAKKRAAQRLLTELRQQLADTQAALEKAKKDAPKK